MKEHTQQQANTPVIPPEQTEGMDEENKDFYRKLRDKITSWAKSKMGAKSKWLKYILLAPDFFYLLVKLSLDPEVPTQEKVKLVIAIAYFISPIDLMPEGLIGPIGYLDDIAVAAYVLNSLLNTVDYAVVEKHWLGEENALDVIQEVLRVADEMIGSGLWQKARALFKGKDTTDTPDRDNA